MEVILDKDGFVRSANSLEVVGSWFKTDDNKTLYYIKKNMMIF